MKSVLMNPGKKVNKNHTYIFTFKPLFVLCLLLMITKEIMKCVPSDDNRKYVIGRGEQQCK